MQRRTCYPVPLALKLNRKTNSLTIKENCFDDLVPCNKPTQRKFIRTAGSSSFSISDVSNTKRGNWRGWLTLRSLERVLLRENFVVWCPKFCLLSIGETNLCSSEHLAGKLGVNLSSVAVDNSFMGLDMANLKRTTFA